MSSERKAPSTSSFEIDADDLHLQRKVKTIRLVDGVRVGLTVLALLMGISTLGVTADSLHTYNETHVSSDFMLALWPENLSTKPAITLVVSSTLVMVLNIVSLIFSKVPTLRNKATLHTSLIFIAPFLGVVAAIVGVGIFYSINASTTDDTLLSWSCRWELVSMDQPPHFGTLCKQSWAGVYLAVLLIPIEAAIFAVAGYQTKVERHAIAYDTARKNTGSPALS